MVVTILIFILMLIAILIVIVIVIVSSSASSASSPAAVFAVEWAPDVEQVFAVEQAQRSTAWVLAF